MYDSLIQNVSLVSTVVFLLAVLYLLVGLVSPGWAGASGRASVVLRSLLGVVLSIGLFIGVIAYTHMQPDGPHSIEGYIKDFDWDRHRVPQSPDPPAEPTNQP